MNLGTSFKRRMCGRLRDTPMLIYGVAGVFGVQCFSISPMHGIAFLISSFQGTGDRIVRALNIVFSLIVCSALSHLHHLAPIELSRSERALLAGYC